MTNPVDTARTVPLLLASLPFSPAAFMHLMRTSFLWVWEGGEGTDKLEFERSLGSGEACSLFVPFSCLYNAAKILGGNSIN